jgi:hypothetical protein
MKAFSLATLDDVGNARLTGETLAMKVKKMSPAQRAALAARMVRWEVSVGGFIPMQAAALTKVGVGNVRLAAGASEADIAALKRGQMSLRSLRAKRSAERVQAALNALTDIGALTPTQVAAE